MSQFAKDSLGTRMKRYEDVSRTVLTPRMPVIVRIDGRAFHTFTKGFLPFDNVLRSTMLAAAVEVTKEMQGFEIAYHQSDEVSFLLTDYAELETSAWFDYVTQKVCTIAASVMTAHFNFLIQERVITHFLPGDQRTQRRMDAVWKDHNLSLVKRFAYFDARAFNIPKEDVANYYLWRCKDWERNSLQMFCRQFFSPKQMHGQGRADQHEMLGKIGKNWETDVPDPFRNGTFLVRGENGEINGIDNVQARYSEIATLIEPLVYKKQGIKVDAVDLVLECE